MTDDEAIRALNGIASQIEAYAELIVRKVLDGTYDSVPVSQKDRALNYFLGISSGIIDVILSDDLPRPSFRLAEMLRKGIAEGRISPFEGVIYDREGKAHGAEEAGEPIHAAMLLAVCYGLRRSEIAGLRWKDIDFEHNIIHVRRTSQYTAEKGIYTDTTKTRKSKRVSKMPVSIMNLLKQFKAEQDTEAEQLGTKWEDHDRLFTKWNGEPMNPQTPFEWLKGYCERIGVPFKNIHSLRHLHASLLIFEGVDVVAVSADMGHSVVGTTLNLYSHMFQEARARNCEAITNALKFAHQPAECVKYDVQNRGGEQFGT